MADQSDQLVQKLWNYCNNLREDLSACGHAQAGGLSYSDYPSAWSILSVAEGLRTGSEQFTCLLFLKMADEQNSTAWKMVAMGAK